MTNSPAQRYAAAKARNAEQQTLFGSFRKELSYELDRFQIEGCEAIQRGNGVLVAAPTSAGKTIVGQFAAYFSVAKQSRCFYTTPIKALSNQKFSEFVEIFGEEHVGLLTGDNTINGDAPIVVMTTEVLRNMLYESTRNLADLSHVVMDEVHYLADRSRGAVWEEVIIHLPEHVRVVALSATVSNAEEFGDWLSTVRGKTDVIVEEVRPTPLHQMVMVGSQLYELFAGSGGNKVNPDLMRIAHNERTAPRGRGRGFHSRYTPSRVSVIEKLAEEDLLPSITFIFSRAACDDAVQQCLAAGLSLTTREEELEIRGIVDQRFADLSVDELRALNYQSWAQAIERGIASHHAGLIPAFKEVTEELFQRGLIKAVFATETLSLGINMPARSVVLEKLTKWNGSMHNPVTPGEYTQLTGRAGRRGIDFQGHAIVVWHQDLDPQALAGLATTRTYPLRSSFGPSYNMAVNLISKYGTHQARELLESSFAQFQADRAVVGIATQLRRTQEAQSGYQESMECHLGDFASYMQLRDELSRLEKGTKRDSIRERRFSNTSFLNELVRGDVFVMTSGRRDSVAHVVINEAQDLNDPRPRVMSLNKQIKRVGVFDLGEEATLIGRVVLPPTFDSRSPKTRQWLAEQLMSISRNQDKKQGKRPSEGRVNVDVERLRKAIRQHPCHGCSDRDDHVRWFERSKVSHNEIEKLEQRVEQRTSSIAREFDRVCAVLTSLGYLETVEDGHKVTERGEVLRGIYCERDLLVAQCLEKGTWLNLTAEQLASAASTLVYESRRADDDNPISLPDGTLGDVVLEMQQMWGEIKDVEQQHRVDFTTEMDFGFMWPTLRWSRGQEINRVLRGQQIAAGDFVRWIKQVIDLLKQISNSTDDEDIRGLAARTAASMERGIVTW